MRLIESIRNYIISCPYLSDSRVNIDWQGAEPTEYSIDGTPVDPIVKRYVDGGTERQFNFVFSSVERYGQDVLNNIRNSGFYEDFAAWVEEQNRNGNLPILGDGLIPKKVEVLTTGCLFDNSPDKGWYQIQCRLLYYKD